MSNTYFWSCYLFYYLFLILPLCDGKLFHWALCVSFVHLSWCWPGGLSLNLPILFCIGVFAVLHTYSFNALLLVQMFTELSFLILYTFLLVFECVPVFCVGRYYFLRHRRPVAHIAEESWTSLAVIVTDLPAAMVTVVTKDIAYQLPITIAGCSLFRDINSRDAQAVQRWPVQLSPGYRKSHAITQTQQ